MIFENGTLLKIIDPEEGQWVFIPESSKNKAKDLFVLSTKFGFGGLETIPGNTIVLYLGEWFYSNQISNDMFCKVLWSEKIGWVGYNALTTNIK